MVVGTSSKSRFTYLATFNLAFLCNLDAMPMRGGLHMAANYMASGTMSNIEYELSLLS